MSEALSPWRAKAPPQFRPEMIIGAASPLWAYFTGAALSGVALWWMTRWLPYAELRAAGGAVGEALATAQTPPIPVGGEAAPVSPVMMIADPGPGVDPAPQGPAARRRRAAEAEPKPH